MDLRENPPGYHVEAVVLEGEVRPVGRLVLDRAKTGTLDVAKGGVQHRRADVCRDQRCAIGKGRTEGVASSLPCRRRSRGLGLQPE